MTDYVFDRYFLYMPELFVLVSLFIPSFRGWIRKLIEDSDGDPNHVDGFFIIILYLAMQSFRMAFIATFDALSTGERNWDISGGYMTVGMLLLGVRGFRNKILASFNRKLNR